MLHVYRINDLLLLGQAMCDMAAALNPASAGLSGWNCSAGIPPPLVVCRWGEVGCNDDLLVARISLGYYGLSGTIPTSIGGLMSITYLNLFQNKLSGSIPTSIGGMTLMNTLALFLNKLTGTVPSNIDQMSALNSLDFGYNMLVGVIPSTFCSLHLSYFRIKESGNTCYPDCLSTISNLYTDTTQKVCSSSPTGRIHLYNLHNIFTLTVTFSQCHLVPCLANPLVVHLRCPLCLRENPVLFPPNLLQCLPHFHPKNPPVTLK